MNKYGYEIITSLSDGQTLPNDGDDDSNSMAYIGQNTGGRIAISCFAKTALAVITGKTLYFEIQAYTADDDASATSPFSSAGSLEADAHVYPLHKTAVDNALDIAAGEMIWQYIIPQFWFDKLGYDWVQVKFDTDDNLSSQTVDIFTHFIA